MNNRNSALLAVLIVLVTANLGLTAWLAFRQPPATTAVATADANPDGKAIDEQAAEAFAKRLIGHYNANDVDAVYALFDDLARVQLPREKLAEQMTKLHEVLGRVDEVAFERSELAGTNAGTDYYNLHYRASLTGGPFRSGTMKLTVVQRGDALNLFGFFLNGADNSLD